jgi:hypothetical protein
VLAVERLDMDWEREVCIFVVLADKTGLARAAQFLLSAVSSPELTRQAVTPCLHFWIFFLAAGHVFFLKIHSDSERENNFGAEDKSTNRSIFFRARK